MTCPYCGTAVPQRHAPAAAEHTQACLARTVKLQRALNEPSAYAWTTIGHFGSANRMLMRCPHCFALVLDGDERAHELLAHDL